MAKNNDDVTYGTAQAKVSEDDALRVRYRAGTPLDGRKIADSEPIDIFSSAHNIENAKQQQEDSGSAAQPQMQRDAAPRGGGGDPPDSKNSSTGTSG